MLGGTSVHFSLAASFFTEVRLVGPVGDDFSEAEFDCSRSRGVIIDDIERVAGGESFFWRGRYDYDLNIAHTEDTQLSVFGDFEPKLSEASKQADPLPRQHPAPPAAPGARPVHRGPLLRAGLDEPLDRHRQGLAAGGDLRSRLRDRQRRRDPPADRRVEPGPRGARRDEDGPRAVVAKQGEYGAALFTESGFFALPGFPLEEVADPTGAGDSFAGGFLGYLDGLGGEIDDACLRRAMGYGTVLASFNVEEFGTERVARLTREEIDERFDTLREMTHFDALPASAE